MTLDSKSERSSTLGSMIFSAIKFLPTLKSTIIPVEKFLRADSNYILKEKERRRQNNAFISYRIDFINRLSPVRYLASIAGGYIKTRRIYINI